MIQGRKLLIVLLSTMVVFSIVQSVEATTMNFTVHGGEDVTKSMHLAVDDRVLIRFTVIGQTSNAIHFYITYPNGTTKDFGKVGTFHFSFVCDAEGEYAQHFFNEASTEDKLITLDYEVQHYILGVPQMLFLTIVVVLICMAAVATFILMGKTH